MLLYVFDLLLSIHLNPCCLYILTDMAATCLLRPQLDAIKNFTFFFCAESVWRESFFRTTHYGKYSSRLLIFPFLLPLSHHLSLFFFLYVSLSASLSLSGSLIPPPLCALQSLWLRTQLLHINNAYTQYYHSQYTNSVCLVRRSSSIYFLLSQRLASIACELIQRMSCPCSTNPVSTLLFHFKGRTELIRWGTPTVT